MNFKIFTDSSASLPDELINKYEIGIISLTYLINDEEHSAYENGQTTDMAKFYAEMRKKVKASTSCANEEMYYNAFKPILEQGQDILHIGFSTALSRSFECSLEAIKKLKKEFPKRKILAISSLCASLGQGRLVITACEQRGKGLSIEETQKYIEDVKLNLVHLFTVEDLFYLYRGGRVSAVSYKLGTLMNIKPVLHVDNLGRLIPIAKVMSRKRSLIDIAERLVHNIVKPEEQTVYVSHGDCIDDVNFLISKINEKIKVKDYVINMVDPVIGSHSGPGTVAIFFYGKER